MSYSKKIKISIADDHPVVLQGLTITLLRHSEFAIETTFTEPRKLLESLNELTCDVLILDLNMGMDAEEMIDQILKSRPGIKIVAFTSYSMPSLVKSVLKGGVKGFVLKHSPEEELIKAIHLVVQGQTYVDSQISGREGIQGGGMVDGFEVALSISAREQEVMMLIAQGLTSKEVATKLFLSHSTIESHKKNIMKKIGAKNIADMIRFATLHYL